MSQKQQSRRLDTSKRRDLGIENIFSNFPLLYPDDIFLGVFVLGGWVFGGVADCNH